MAKQAVRMRIPLRAQISALLVVFLFLAALSSYQSTRNFLERDKTGSVRELQTLSVADISRDLSDRFQKARQQLRESGTRLLDPSRGAVALDKSPWSWIVVRDKTWKNPEAKSVEIPADLRETASDAEPLFSAWPDPKDGEFLILEEPLKTVEGTKQVTYWVHGHVSKRALLGESSRFDRGPIHGLILEASSVKNGRPEDVRKSIWLASPESREQFQNLWAEYGSGLGETLFQSTAAVSRDVASERSEARALVSVASLMVPQSSLQLQAVEFADRGQLLSGFRRTLAEQAFWALLVLGFGVIAAQILASAMSRPIEKMVAATRQLETGDFQVRVPEGRKDELGDLAAAFNHMGLALEERENALKTAQGALVQSEKLAALGTLSAGIAHEVKNPLAGILGHADMAVNQIRKLEISGVDGLVKHIETIQKETKRCRGIIDNLMRFSRNDGGEKKAAMELIDLESVAWEAVHLMEHPLNLAKVKIEKDFAPEAWMIQGNANQIEQVLLNMLQNAGHAMPEGGTLKIRTQFAQDVSELPAGKFVAYQAPEFTGAVMRISIQDSGIGMTEEVQRKIFEPFFTTKPKGVGTGLGLSVTMGILGDHQARVSLNSAPGQGTTFFMDFMARHERTAEVISLLDEVKHRKGGGAKISTDVSASSLPPPAASEEAGDLAGGSSFAESADEQPTHLSRVTEGNTVAVTPPTPSPGGFSVRRPQIKKNG